MKTIVIDLPERMTTEIGALVENGWFANETEIIQTALWEFMRRNRFALAEQFQRADIAWALEQHRDRRSQKASAP
jgi:Arc/MetJ-type ribon-helix-helix transcriptional regulator